MQDYYFTNKTKDVTKMNEKNKKIAAWGFVITLIIASVTIFKSNEPVEVIEEIEAIQYDEPTQVEILTEDLQEESTFPERLPNTLKDAIEEEILHFTDSGILIAPYPDYETFGQAFAFGKGMLGDSAEHGSLRVFMWRGNLYNTETLKQPTATEEVVEEVVEEAIVDTVIEVVVNDTIK